MVLKLEQILGSKNSLAVLRYLVLHSYLSYGITELSEILNISKSNVLRILKVFENEKIIIIQKSGRKKLIRINSELKLIENLWKIFMVEKQMNLQAEFKNIIELFYEEIKKETEVFILFGSVAQGLAKRDSDIDLLVVGKKRLPGPRFKFPFRFEIHNYTWEELEEKKDFVVLDALINGIVYKGDLFGIIKEIKYFPKSYLIYRLSKIKGFLSKAESLSGKAKEYYQDLARISLGEVTALMEKKTIIPKRKIKVIIKNRKIKELEEMIAKEGEKIWLV
ncbi:MAG: nucleotidyltransferase domain-containing protein [Nanoarchaeota archaeon]